MESKKCVQCQSFGRDKFAMMYLYIAGESYPICELCALAIMQQLDANLNSWSLMTGQFATPEGTVTTWQSLGVTDMESIGEGLYKANCPSCEKPGLPLMIERENRSGICRACGKTFIVDK